MSSPFVGLWSGYGEGASNARVHAQIEEGPNGLTIKALSKASDGEGEIIELEGKEESDGTASFSLTAYVSDSSNTAPPAQVHLVLRRAGRPDQLEGNWATDIGTQGDVRLRRAGSWGRFLLNVPLWLHKSYRLVKRYLRFRFRAAYLVAILGLATASVIGFFEEKISTTEAVILLVPLLFLYSDRLRELIASMAVRKLGPVEFQDQTRPSSDFSLSHLVRVLHGEFGDQLPQFAFLSEFFVQRTKSILRFLASLGRRLTMAEFYAIARNLGVTEEKNLQATLEALLRSGCLALNEKGEISVQELGLSFLRFEDRLGELYSR